MEIRSANAASSGKGAKSPVVPSTIESLDPGTFQPTTGVPTELASITDIPNPSLRDGEITTLVSPYSSNLLLSETLPRNLTLFEIPRSTTILASCCWYGPEPATSSFASGNLLTTFENALKANCNPLYFISLLTHPIVFGKRSIKDVRGRPGFVQPGVTTLIFVCEIPQCVRSHAVLWDAPTILDVD